jgi:hypothetical protein
VVEDGITLSGGVPASNISLWAGKTRRGFFVGRVGLCTAAAPSISLELCRRKHPRPRVKGERSELRGDAKVCRVFGSANARRSARR